MIKFQDLETDRLLLKKFNYEDYLKVWAFDYIYYFGIPELEFQDKLNPVDKWIDLEKYGTNNNYDYEKDNLTDMKEIDWLIYIKDSNEVIGTIMAEFNEDFSKCTNFSYMFLRKYWNNGYAYESAERVLDYIFDSGIDIAQATSAETNLSSNKLLTKLGFAFCSTKKHQCLFFDGKKKNFW